MSDNNDVKINVLASLFIVAIVIIGVIGFFNIMFWILEMVF